VTSTSSSTPPSPESAASTSASSEPGCASPGRPRGRRPSTTPARSERTGDGAEPSSTTTGPSCPATPTSGTWRKAQKAHDPADSERWERTRESATLAQHGVGLPGDTLVSYSIHPDAIGRDGIAKADSPDAEGIMRKRDAGLGIKTEESFTLGTGAPPAVASTCSAEGSPARTSASPGSEPGSPGLDRGSSSSSPASPTLFDPSGCSLRTYPDCSPLTMVGTSGSYWRRWPSSGTASRGECSIHATSESPNVAVECSLSDVLETTVSPRYVLSAKAARGVLRRASARGRRLPFGLQMALEATARGCSAPRRRPAASSS
jgi:hypothetical protein